MDLTNQNNTKESPEYLKMSLASAMTLDFSRGFFYRNAKNPCINLLLKYNEGCIANCSYCGLAKNRGGNFDEKTFIKVEWPTFSLDEIIERIDSYKDRVKRICISMVTNKRAPGDVKLVLKRIKGRLKTPLSVLMTPTILTQKDIEDFKLCGTDKVGIAIDTAKEEIFEIHRGKNVKGPHEWKKYWDTIDISLKIFGKKNVGIHLVVGLGETENEMLEIIQKIYEKGALAHLFSFFAENGSPLESVFQPSLGTYYRIQLGRHLIHEGIASIKDFLFDSSGKLISFNVSPKLLDEIIASGYPFMTSGCAGEDGRVACNRPYGNCLPGPDIRNYPFKPNENDVARIRSNLFAD
ncbi:MAG: hypothetical protein A2W05_05330 [Candidatus Schekmanbacteria bacterium RBG_16_38_10]|uniref:Radical SAM core domain-containing protein n=1 Tax=Candidatus Schekmanbacteria bacterium RBG_16_38_10 TaxID=1817879 RepID=A0A1F7RPH8_9BACT|nr:MAG: hypothetical protein A2W05_05330 [Candidatus Schekmanbacteria bacterium RBG_16_38_10]